MEYDQKLHARIGSDPLCRLVGINAILKLVAPKRALSRTEMLTIFFMVWLVGNLPTTGWAGYLLGNISAPVHLASPENRVGDVIAPLLPDWLFMQKSPVVIGQLYGGLEPNTSIPGNRDPPALLVDRRLFIRGHGRFFLQRLVLQTVA